MTTVPSTHVQSSTIDIPGGGRILCIADTRGSVEDLNRLVAEAKADICIHTGDFGFYEPASLDRISDRTLKHLVTYSPILPPHLKKTASTASRRDLLKSLESSGSSTFPLSQFPALLSKQIKLSVPTFCVSGACEDVRVLEKLRTGEYLVENLTVLDEATTRLLTIGGCRLRLFGLGGALVMNKMFDNGEGNATIAGGQGTMWTTCLQMGELIDTAQRFYDPSEVRLLISHTSLGKEPILSLISQAIKADLTVSAGLHFRYGASFNEFSIQDDVESWSGKVARSQKRFSDVWDLVKIQVEQVIDPDQRIFLDKALAAINSSTPSSSNPTDDPSSKNVWSWNLTDAAFGSLILDVQDGKIGAELKSQGFSFAHRTPASIASAPVPAATPLPSATTAPARSSPFPPSSGPSQPTAIPVTNGSTRPTFAPGSKGPRAPREPFEGRASTPGSQISKGTPLPPTPAPGSAASPKPSAPSSTTPAPTSTTIAKPSSPSDETGLPSSSEKPLPAGPRTGSPANSNAASSPVDSRAGGSLRKNPFTPWTLYVSLLPKGITENEVREFFGDSAKGIKSVKLLFDHITKQAKSFCYVEFNDEDTMNVGLQIHGDTIRGSNPKVVISTIQENSPSSSFRGSGRGRGGIRPSSAGRGGRGGSRNVSETHGVSSNGPVLPKPESAPSPAPATA